jgi:hypothetical protein
LCHNSLLNQRAHALKIFHRINSNGRRRRLDDLDLNAPIDGAQLFERFAPFGFRLRPAGKLQKKLAPVRVQSGVFAKRKKQRRIVPERCFDRAEPFGLREKEAA